MSIFELLTTATGISPQNCRPLKQAKPPEDDHVKSSQPQQSLPGLRSFDELDEIKLRIPFTTPTSIQSATFGFALHGHSILACAPTGSGKTLAFLLPILVKQCRAEPAIMAKQHLFAQEQSAKPEITSSAYMIIAPTRDLAVQIWRTCVILFANLPVVIRHVSIKMSSKIPKQKVGWPIIDIGTPGTFAKLYKTNLNNLQMLVCDEIDKLLEPDFKDCLLNIIELVPSSAQKLFFTATLPAHIEQFFYKLVPDGLRIIVGRKDCIKKSIAQRLVYCGDEQGKLMQLRQFLCLGNIRPPILIFVQSIQRAKQLYAEFKFENLYVDVIHSELEQPKRNRALNRIRQGKTWILICTELLSRGIDIKGVNMVINYDFPQSVASYIHRVGRTARADRVGEAITFYTKEDRNYLKIVLNVLRNSGCEVPEWMLKLKSVGKKTTKFPIKRKDISMEVITKRAKTA